MVRDDLVDRRTVGVDSRSEGPEIGNKSNFIQALEERGYERRPYPSGYATEQPNHCHGWLLGTRPERPCRRATEQRNELAPPHAAFPPAAMSAQALSSFF
jgi:hypothetical protein